MGTFNLVCSIIQWLCVFIVVICPNKTIDWYVILFQILILCAQLFTLFKVSKKENK